MDMSDHPDENNVHRVPPLAATQPVSREIDARIYQHLVREVRDYAIFMLDPGGHVQTWNAGAERLNGYRPEEIIGQHFSRFFPEEDIRSGKPEWELKTALQEGRIEDEGWRIRKDGSRFWANVVITAVYDEMHHHVGFAKITRDLTDRRAAEEALRRERAELEKRVEERTAALSEANRELARANRELEKASRTKDQFLAMLSHELRTPLTAIYGWVSMLQSGRVDAARVMDVIQIIERNVKSQTQLVDDLLNLSRVITGNLKVAPAWIDPLVVVHAAVDSMRPAAMAKNIHLVVEAETSEQIFADADRLQQVIWNLLSNAVKFTGKGGEVRVEVGRIASKFQVTVSDTGEGIDPDFLPHVFDRFSQADSSTTRRFGGLGLGLSIVRHIVELHGGSVFAHSEGKGRGTTMIVRLPVPAIRPPEICEPKRDSEPSLEGLRVMIVEDEADTQAMLQQALESYGAAVLVARSAAEALEQIAAEKPDLLVSDIGLPNMDGYELLSKVRSELPDDVKNIPAVALTAFAGAEHLDRSKLAGYQAHVAKPVAISDLISILAKVAKET
jgi:PAS domain S-box-containing protein